MTGDSARGGDFERVLPALRRRFPIVLACTLVAGASAYFFAHQATPLYTATASLNFTGTPLGQSITGLGGQQGFSQSTQDTNVQLVALGNTASKTAAILNAAARHPGVATVAGLPPAVLQPRWSGPRVAAVVSISASGDTSIVNIAATAKDPAVAQFVANVYANTFVTNQLQQAQAQIQAAERATEAELKGLTPAQRLGPQGVALAQRQEQLQYLASVDTGGVTLAGAATRPTSPSSPKVHRDALLGALLGLMVGLAIAFGLERFDRRMRDPKDFEAIYGVPVLAAVPEQAEYRVEPTLRGWSAYDEVFRMLRSYLRYFAIDRTLQMIAVISADSGEGKTTVSFNLAKAAATLGSRVLVVEADLRRGTVIEGLHHRPEPSLADVLLGDAPLRAAIRSIDVKPRGTVDVLIAGATTPPNVGELMESHAMASVLEQVRAAYDLVVLDTPPVGVVADAIPLLKRVDGVIIVGRVGTSRSDAAQQLHERLTSLDSPVLGIVANRVRSSDVSRYRRRHYGYYYYGAAAGEPGTNGAATNGEPRGVSAGSRQRMRAGAGGDGD